MVLLIQRDRSLEPPEPWAKDAGGLETDSAIQDAVDAGSEVGSELTGQGLRVQNCAPTQSMKLVHMHNAYMCTNTQTKNTEQITLLKGPGALNTKRQFL